MAQKFHFRSSSIPRIEAAVKLYASLRNIQSVRGGVTKKMTSLLLHPYPMVGISLSSSLDFLLCFH